MAAQPQPVSASPTELVELCAADNRLYCDALFPSTFRQESPPFHDEIWSLLEDRAHRYVAAEVFRGGAKTTLLRAYTSKRIAYGASRTILFVSAAQDLSEKSIAWIKGQIVRNSTWAGVFGLERGPKWTDNEIKISNKALGIDITLVALGITGQIRGINIEDYRPDLIVVDDPCDEENTATPEQRRKTSDLFFGALDKSLSPETECPDAKMVLLQTPLNREDLISNCARDPQWAHRKFGCFDDSGKSRWPARYTTERLKRAKEAHILRGQLDLWMREMECQIVSSESCDFRESWLQYYEDYEIPQLQNMMICIGIDPVPPPSERELEVGLRRKDYEVISAVGVADGNYYVLDLVRSRGHSPEWTLAQLFEMIGKWRPIKVRVESVGYQRTLKWLIEQEMNKRHHWIQVEPAIDKRAKSVRIRQAFSGIGSARRLFVRKSYVNLIDQFTTYPNCVHDDDLDSVSIALDGVKRFGGLSDDSELIPEGQDSAPELVGWRQAP